MSDTLKNIKVETDNGEIKEAEVINIFTKDNVDYAIYAIDNGNETSDLYASRIVVDQDGNTNLINIENNNEKTDIIRYIQELVSKLRG